MKDILNQLEKEIQEEDFFDDWNREYISGLERACDIIREYLEEEKS
jgi:hypothetical protein